MADYKKKEIQDFELSYWIKNGLRVGTQMYVEYAKVFEVDYDFSGKTVLDIGCGPFGGMLSIIKARKKIGIDPLTERYREKFKLNLGDIIMRDEYIEETSLNDEVADVIFCCNALDHVRDPEKVVQQIHRLLKNGGTFYLYVHMRTKEQLNIGHVFVFTEDQLENWFKDFKLIKKKTFIYDPVILAIDIIKNQAVNVARSYAGVWKK